MVVAEECYSRTRSWVPVRRHVVEEECYQYRSGETSSSGECQTPRRSSRPYQLTCANGTTIQLSRDEMIGMQPPYRIASKEQDIMHELYYSGPVQAIMQVHEDFFSYRSGVYRPTRLRQSSRTAHHSVRLLGWGEQPGPRGEPVKYWIAANSWGRQWGEDGLFRIVRGQNEADIETFVVGAWAKPSRGDRRRSRGYRQYRRNRRHHLRARRHHKTTKQ
ncbi:uncharacterized peptidase C1-like protein F26E4.3 [Pollicipes pollicipes]|uniref:uncharacterized peptidase C1-like protein F26E4.3 n=1 Tax=Pollicipes pollicipes TaxID=41117 RepID=UPI0018851843|nr:uncharacterized peptidase C1-like protein F26E4.3 [Pollicipes pollicipes]